VDRRTGKAGYMSDQLPHQGSNQMGNHPSAKSGSVAVHGQSEGSSVRPPIIERVVRPQDADPRRANRAERAIALMFLISAAGTVGFIVSYLAVPSLNTIDDVQTSNLLLGCSLAISLGGLAAGIIAWVRWLMPAHETIQERHELAASDEDLETAVQVVMAGLEETGIARRSLLKRTLGLALGLFALPAVLLLRDVGPLPRRVLDTTLWAAGSPLLYEDGKPVKLGDLEIGSFTTVLPLNVDDPLMTEEELAKAAVLLIRLEPGEDRPAPGRENWAYQGHVAYSKICTHVGCPISLYQKQSHKLLCPCHQSTFDVPNACKVVFGPAARALPQLPISVNANGEFVATAGFDQPIGPSFFERS
jgi:ubiquinol-cytochrome c reductase iron-sulfur subunit